MREFIVEFGIRKGLSAEYVTKNISIGLDDLDPEMPEHEIIDMAKRDAEQQLYDSDDYPIYGKNWIFREIYNA